MGSKVTGCCFGSCLMVGPRVLFHTAFILKHCLGKSAECKLRNHKVCTMQVEKKIKEDIISALETVYDPEIPVSIWSLGLVYDIDIDVEALILDIENPSALLGKAIYSIQSIQDEEREIFRGISEPEEKQKQAYDPKAIYQARQNYKG